MKMNEWASEWLLFITFLHKYRGRASLKKPPPTTYNNPDVSDAFVPDPDYGLRGRNNEKIMKAWIGSRVNLRVKAQAKQ